MALIERPGGSAMTWEPNSSVEAPADIKMDPIFPRSGERLVDQAWWAAVPAHLLQIIAARESSDPHSRPPKRLPWAITINILSIVRNTSAFHAEGQPCRRRSYAVAAAGRRCLRSAVGLRVNHFRHPHARARGADCRSRFHFLVSAARTGPTAPRSDGAGRADCAAGAAAAAELRRHRRWPPVPPRRRRVSASTMLGNYTRARGGRRVRSVFSFLPFRSAPAPTTDGTGRRSCRRRLPSYAVTAAGRRCLHSAVGGPR
jgi:hypothetical protein